MAILKNGIIGKLAKSIGDFTNMKIGKEYYIMEKSEFEKETKSQIEIENMARNKDYQKLLSFLYKALKNKGIKPNYPKLTYYNLLQKWNTSNYYKNGNINYSLIEFTNKKENYFNVKKIKYSSDKKELYLALNKLHNQTLKNSFKTTLFLVYCPLSDYAKVYLIDNIFEVSKVVLGNIQSDLVGTIYLFNYVYNTQSSAIGGTSFNQN